MTQPGKHLSALTIFFSSLADFSLAKYLDHVNKKMKIIWLEWNTSHAIGMREELASWSIP